MQHIGGAHAAQIAQQGKNRIVTHDQPLVIDDRQCEPGALQECAELAHVGKRGNARRDASLDLAFSRGDGFAQLSETFSADQRRQ